MAKNKWKSKEREQEVWQRIKEHQQDPDFIRAAYEFIRLTTGKSPQ